MLVFYPLEYISFFSSPIAPLLRTVSPANSAKAQLWSVRAWGVYTALQVIILRNEWNAIIQQEQNAADADKGPQDKAAIEKRKTAIIYGLVANVSRLPVILHW